LRTLAGLSFGGVQACVLDGQRRPPPELFRRPDPLGFEAPPGARHAAGDDAGDPLPREQRDAERTHHPELRDQLEVLAVSAGDLGELFDIELGHDHRLPALDGLERRARPPLDREAPQLAQATLFLWLGGSLGQALKATGLSIYV